MSVIDKILSQLEDCITNNYYLPVETEKVELKPTPPNLKGAAELCKSVCAFMNTHGGILILGIKDNNNIPEKNYALQGYREDFETILTKELGLQFTDKDAKPFDVNDYIVNHEIRNFLDNRICIIYIDKLPDEHKYAFFRNVAYQRKLTGDHIINENMIAQQEEYKEEIRQARELVIVKETSIMDIDLNKLNEYIHLLNREIQSVTIKANIEEAKSFLTRKRFIIDNKITTLGMLVCGKDIKDHLGWRSQVDGFVETPFDVAQDKKSIIDNVIPLMEKSLSYILNNIRVGVSIEKGGTSKPEYPEQLIRETINNAIAHRDYSVNKYININIKPNDSIEIRNPGAFKEQLLLKDFNNEIPIRRIIPDSKPINPNLADILKVFDKWEGKNRGMSSLTNEALNNTIDLPYYVFRSKNELSLFLKKGKLLDEKMELLFSAYNGYIEKKLRGEALTVPQKLVLAYFYKSEVENKNDRFTILLTKDNNHLSAINSLEDCELIVKHPISNDLYPVYIINRELFKKDFINELRSIFGADFDALSKEERAILACVYEFNTYSKDMYPSANTVGKALWIKQGNINILEGYDSFMRKVRKSISKINNRGVILKVEEKHRYKINDAFTRRPSLYDTE
jgi:ATP-dependent DNA helicase RecG